MRRTILIVESEEPAMSSADAALSVDYRTLAVRSGQEAIRHLSTEPDVALIALSLSDMGGLDLCRHMRERAPATVIFVTGPDSEADALASYAAGADGYLTKPYGLRELDARIRAALRRLPATFRQPDAAITVGDVSLDLERHETRVRGRLVQMPLREFELLSVLLTNPGKVLTREALMHRLWRETPASGTKSLDVHVGRIRRRIEDDPSRPSRILTVRGIGYRYAVPTGDPAMSHSAPTAPVSGPTIRNGC